MSSNIANTTPYLLATRRFPNDLPLLTEELRRSYIDTANAVNLRTIGIFTNDRSIITGESWFTRGGNLKQQSLRQVYTFTSFAAITHNITLTDIAGFVRIFGAFTDGTNWYPLPYVNPTAANQVGVSITATQIVFAVGGGAPVPTSGTIVLEWLSNV